MTSKKPLIGERKRAGHTDHNTDSCECHFTMHEKLDIRYVCCFTNMTAEKSTPRKLCLYLHTYYILIQFQCFNCWCLAAWMQRQMECCRMQMGRQHCIKQQLRSVLCSWMEGQHLDAFKTTIYNSWHWGEPLFFQKLLSIGFAPVAILGSYSARTTS